MHFLLNRLRAAAGWGALLAAGTGCGGDAVGATSGGGGSGSGGTGADAGGQAGDASPGGADAGGAGGASGAGGTQPDAGGASGSGGAPSDAGVDAPPEPKVPYPDAAGCFGPVHDGGYWGQCCEYVGCLERENGACPSAALASEVLGGPYGSGYCHCGAGPTGPFLPRDPATEDECCYLYSWISCDGRPLTVAGVVRRAPPVRRADWARIRTSPTPPWELAA